MRRLALGFVVLAALAVGEAPAAEPLGRLFFTQEQRAQMDVARAQRSRATLAAEIEEQAPIPEVLTYRGVVRRSDGKSTVWINDRSIDDGKEVGRLPPAKPRPDGSIVLELPQSERKVNLKVGQSVELLSGTIAEPYARSPLAPKPAVKPPAEAGTSAPPESQPGGEKPAPAETARPKPEPSAPVGQMPTQIPPGTDRAAVEAQLEAALEQVRRERQAERTNAPERR